MKDTLNGINGRLDIAEEKMVRSPKKSSVKPTNLTLPRELIFVDNSQYWVV